MIKSKPKPITIKPIKIPISSQNSLLFGTLMSEKILRDHILRDITQGNKKVTANRHLKVRLLVLKNKIMPSKLSETSNNNGFGKHLLILIKDETILEISMYVNIS